MGANEMKKNSSKPHSKKKVRLRKGRVAEFSIALLLTVLLLVLAPVLAWFGNQQRIAKLAKIKAPDELYINAAHREDKVYLDMRTIEVSKKWDHAGTAEFITSQSFPFTVSGEWVNSFILQMDYTTNNPYTFTVHEGTIYKKTGNDYINIYTEKTIAEEHPDYNTRNTDGSLKYVEYTATGNYDPAEAVKIPDFPDDGIRQGDLLLIYIGNEVSGTTLNPGSDRAADNSKKEKSYGTYDEVNKYVNPKYWQSNTIYVEGSKNVPFYKTYVVKVSWDAPDNQGNYAIESYNKETDIVYLSAFVN